MGNQHSASHHSLKPRKNVHWKSAGRPAAPGKPEIIPLSADEEPNAITLRWRAGAHDGGAPLRGYQVECNRLGTPEWIRTSPPVVLRPELVLSGLEPPHRYQFRVAAINAVGRSELSELSDVLTVSPEPAPHRPPIFVRHLEDQTTLENDKTEFRVQFDGAPPPSVAWFKDEYEIFSSRRTAICTDDSSSVLVFHQTLASDEGEIRCTATNRSGHAVTRARLAIEAAPKLRYPRQYEDGLLYEVNETVFLKTTIVGKPAPTVEWRHDGRPLVPDDRVEVTNTPRFSVLKIHAARRSDRGEYQVHARNGIGEDTAAFLVTITAPPEPPQRVSVTRQVDKSVTLDWQPPADDGGCRIGNYVVEYYRAGWNVWLKATTSRKTNATLFDLIEGSEYRFRVKAESPYGMSAPSEQSAPVRIPGRAVDMDFLAVEARIINDALTQQEGEVEARVSPAPRRKRSAPPPASPTGSPALAATDEQRRNDEFMLVLYPETTKTPTKAEKRESFQLDLDSLSPPPLSLSAPELSSRCIAPFPALRHAVSSTELLHEHAMARFYKAVAMKEEQAKRDEQSKQQRQHDIPYNTSRDRTAIDYDREPPRERVDAREKPREPVYEIEPPHHKPPNILIKSDSGEYHEYKESARQASQDSETSEHKWQHSSFEEDYTASTVSTDEEFSDEGSLNGDMDRSYFSHEEETYNPRDKFASHSSLKESLDDEQASEHEILKPLPLPDPNFIPKPILKKRELPDIQSAPHNLPLNSNGKPIVVEKPKKDDKITMFKKITKMPKQRSFPFPNILSKKEPGRKVQKNNVNKEKDKNVVNVKQQLDKISDEGRTVIDYYGSIVKEYGTQKKPVAPLCLNTDDLKTVAKKQQTEQKQEIVQCKKVPKVKKPVSETINGKDNTTKLNNVNSVRKTQLKPKQNNIVKSERKQPVTSVSEKQNNQQVRCTQQIVLKKTERATIVIPIDYQELEKKAKLTVRSAIDYSVDVCLLMLAFWVYLFKDERLAIPFLTLLIYRQLQETICLYIPEWFRRHTPNWLKKKTS